MRREILRAEYARRGSGPHVRRRTTTAKEKRARFIVPLREQKSRAEARPLHNRPESAAKLDGLPDKVGAGRTGSDPALQRQKKRGHDLSCPYENRRAGLKPGPYTTDRRARQNWTASPTRSGQEGQVPIRRCNGKRKEGTIY